MYNAEQHRQNRQYYLSQGRCPRCGGSNPVQKGRALCVECQQKHDDEQTKRRNLWKSEGRCIRCGGERAEGRSQCQKCLDDRKAKNINAAACAKRRQKKILEGRCIRCGTRFAALGHVMCEKCLEAHRDDSRKSNQNGAKAKARREARIAAGLCIDCGKPTDREGKARCSACLAARRDSTRKYQILKRMDREAEEARRRSYAGNS